MNYQLTYPALLRGSVMLPSSKSISARALILSALGGGCHLNNLSECDDTIVMKEALTVRSSEIDIHGAGTAMRFLTAYFATCDGEAHVLTGSERMQNRPIGILVDALRKLGADVTYLGKEGYPPLQIKGRRLRGGVLDLPANVSSQFISALLMIGPLMTDGLALNLVGKIASLPYIEMTVAMMRDFGANVVWETKQSIEVHSSSYSLPKTYDVEPDWSAASYWYEMMALTSDQDACIVLPYLRHPSIQGDCVVADLFEKLGVGTEYHNNSAILRKKKRMANGLTIDERLDKTPDIVQTLAVTLALLGQPFKFAGVESLRIKETDRITALLDELKKIGVVLCSEKQNSENTSSEFLEMSQAQTVNAPHGVSISTYDDHRMAMAFAPVAICCPGLIIQDVEVVCKSYPGFWKDLQQIGVELAPVSSK